MMKQAKAQAQTGSPLVRKINALKQATATVHQISCSRCKRLTTSYIDEDLTSFAIRLIEDHWTEVDNAPVCSQCSKRSER
jgi:hypothetical protein